MTYYIVGTTYYVCDIFFKMSISRHLLIRMHSCLDHGYPVGLAFIPCHRTQGSMPVDGATASKSSTCSKYDMSALKFSRSLYLDNHLSESIHAWIKGTIYGWLSLHNIDPWVPARTVVDAKTSKLSKCGILASNVSRSPYLDNHLWEKWGWTGSVVSVADYGPRGPWFEIWPRHSLLWPWASHICPLLSTG